MSDAALAPPKPVLPAGLARHPFAVLLLLCLVAWLPGVFSLPPMDRDEARFAQASKQMVESGNLVDIRFGKAPRYKKPIGIYWLQAAATRLFGAPPYREIWTYRLPSLLGALFAVFLAYWSVRALAPPEAALIAAALLALTLALGAEARLATTDAVLLATVVAAQGVLLRLYLAAQGSLFQPPPGSGLAMAGWVALAAGILVKGPVILGIAGLTVAVLLLWEREARWLATARPLPGVLLLLALVLPWLVAIGIQSHGQFYQRALGHDFAAKLAGGQESHGAPPGYYLLLSTLTLWPATLFVLPGLGAAWARRREPAIRFLLAWTIGCWLMFELVPTKLPHYILPVYPALTVFAALWLTGGAEETRATRILRWIAAVQFAVGVVAIATALVILPGRYGSGMPAWIMVLAAVGAASGLGAATLLLAKRRWPALGAAALSALIFYPLLMWGVAPRLTQIWLSPRVAAWVAKHRAPGDPPVVTAGYDEPSLVFLLGTDTRIETGSSAADAAAATGGLALIDAKQRAAFLARLAADKGEARAVDELSGLNYSTGRKEQITLYRVTPAQ
ncbi:MAG: glycosyltransferase family 39 protein [Alphaproteobacteria bacterium]|nr:glycosyltransferase family 39 protein [Alphaproteobacteria bacterium]MDE2014061.1 glycosyltransferase family 39 protein [Alphaproteobacteria bacterium]MDE2075021.1 glycosyltransferase family 39 protein [Alphaproteobacteria bacterium]MDE2352096.1 glycosyltransferase family 39 protein [Alphaproteobacteria bacterium]